MGLHLHACELRTEYMEPLTIPLIICQEVLDVIHVDIKTVIPKLIQKCSISDRKFRFATDCDDSSLKEIRTLWKYVKKPTFTPVRYL